MNEEQAYQDGFDAKRTGEPASSNPHSVFRAALYEAWTAGWLDGRDNTPIHPDIRTRQP